MIVYRLEDANNGEGPFKNRGDLWEHDDFSDWRYRHIGSAHPGPMSDSITMPWRESERERLVFGCPSKEMIDFWFEPGYNMFKSAGYVINVYKVHGNAVKKGRSGTQVVFNRDKATLVETIEIP